MNTHTRAALVRQAFHDAISDRLQSAADNAECAIEHAQTLQAQATLWSRVQLLVVPESAYPKRLTLHDIHALPAEHFSVLCDVLYFASVFRLSLIKANEHTRTSVAADQALRRRYLSLLHQISEGSEPGAPLISADPREVIALVPEAEWETTEDGGKIFRPKLPNVC